MEKYELHKRLEDLNSRDYDPGPARVSLREEISEIEDFTISNRVHKGIFSFVHVVDEHEEEIKLLKDREEQGEKVIRELNCRVNELVEEIERKNEEIVVLESKLRTSLTSPKGRNSFFSKVKPNPLVLALFHDRNAS